MRNLRRTYETASQITLNTVLLLLATNVFLAAVFFIRDLRTQEEQKVSYAKRPGQPELSKKRNGYQMTWVDTRAYEGVPKKQVNLILDDFYDFQLLGTNFEPYVDFSDPLFESATLKIVQDEKGFAMRAMPGLERSEHKVFFFGGSTTLGWNVDDQSTIPYYFQKHLASVSKKMDVRNYGRTNYSWYQELVLLQRLVHSGQIPDHAIFLDGVNIHNVGGARQIPHWNQSLSKLWYEKQHESTPEVYPSAIPMFRLMNYFNRFRRVQKAKSIEKEKEKNLNPKEVRASYLNTIRQASAIGKEFGFEVTFIWQPNRAYRCSSEIESTQLPSDYRGSTAKIYEEMKQPGPYHNLSGLCENYGRGSRVFVDDVHYSPKFNELMAREIAALLLKENESEGQTPLL